MRIGAVVGNFDLFPSFQYVIHILTLAGPHAGGAVPSIYAHLGTP